MFLEIINFNFILIYYIPLGLFVFFLIGNMMSGLKKIITKKNTQEEKKRNA